MISSYTCVAVTGASSFIGRHLVRALSRDEHLKIRLLVHRRPLPWMMSPRISLLQGDLMVPESLHGFLRPDCLLIHLAFLPTDDLRHHIQSTIHLADACRAVGIRRLVHCSTSVIVGSAKDSEITEETRCRPVSGYEINKFEIERHLSNMAQGNFDLGILRPTAVFGEGGRNLEKLVGDLLHGRRWVNYIRSCIYNRRRMNLVPVDHVVAAIRFLSNMPGRLQGEKFILAQDDEPMNNYRDIEKYLMRGLGVSDYAIPRCPLPDRFLSALLRSTGRSNTNPPRIYSSRKSWLLDSSVPPLFNRGWMLL
jgi:nucleoside-diphosphate-sugar epimerase